MDTTEHNIEAHLSSANRRLAELLHSAPADLATGSARSLQDRLWVWGILGGKDVGKSTLINALAGAEVVHRGTAVGEGTYQPAAYLHDGDRDALDARFATLGGVSFTVCTDAPPSMRGLVLVDLPDFDSMYTDHLTQVRAVAGALDGIICVTTPKKVGDLRAINEIQRVLKARNNFVYVVNKMDWLLGQSDGHPSGELDRMSAALNTQMAECGVNGDAGRSFFISAKHRTADSIIDEIARHHPTDSPRSPQPEMVDAARRVADDFDALRDTLTTAPTAEAADNNKRANLTFQVRAQARTLLDHHNPNAALDSLQRNANPETIEEIVVSSFSQVYCDQLIKRMNAGRLLSAEWSALLFRQRIAHWPVLGIIAWPLALLGAIVGTLRSLVPRPAATQDDPFRFDGLALQDRTHAAISGVNARLAGTAERIEFELPSAGALEHQFRSDISALANAYRQGVIDPLTRRRPSFPGRCLRWLTPAAVLIWFPLAQPLLSGFLAATDAGPFFTMENIRLVVELLSAGNLLMGLGVSVLILCGLVACIYSCAVRDSFRAIDRLQDASPDATAAPLIDALTRTITRPIETVRSQLTELTNDLQELAARNTYSQPRWVAHRFSGGELERAIPSSCQTRSQRRDR